MKKIIIVALFCILLSGFAFAAAESYILRDMGGYVCVFEKNDLVNPSLETAIPVQLLPQADQQRLREGIEVNGRSELYSILEDLGS